MRIVHGAVAIAMWLLVEQAAAVGAELSATAENSGSDDEVMDALGRMDLAFLSLDRVELIVRESTSATRSSDDAAVQEDVWLRVRKDGERVAILQNRQVDTLLAESLPPGFLQELIVGEPSVQINCRAADDGSLVLGSLAPDVDSYAVFGSLNAGPTQSDISWIGYLRSAKALFGYLDGDDLQSLGDIMRSGTVELVESSIESGVLLSCKSDYGVHRIWLDRETNLPRRIEVKKSADDLLGDLPIREHPETSTVDSVWPEGKIASFEQTVGDIVFRDHEGLSYIGEYTLERKYHYANRDELIFFTTLSIGAVTALKTERNDELFRPSLPIPDGTPVRLNGVPNIRYMWNDGEIVVDDTPAAFTGVDALRYSPPESGFRILLIWVNLAVILVIVAVVMTRRWRRGGS